MKWYSLSHLTQVVETSSKTGEPRFVLNFGDKAAAVVSSKYVSPVYRTIIKKDGSRDIAEPIGEVAPVLANHVTKLFFTTRKLAT